MNRMYSVLMLRCDRGRSDNMEENTVVELVISNDKKQQLYIHSNKNVRNYSKRYVLEDYICYNPYAASTQHYLCNKKWQFCLQCHVFTEEETYLSSRRCTTSDQRRGGRWCIIGSNKLSSIPLYHIIINLSLERQKYLSMLNHEINAFLSLRGIGLRVISAAE